MVIQVLASNDVSQELETLKVKIFPQTLFKIISRFYVASRTILTS